MLHNWYKRPDWFAVVGVPRLYEENALRLSYVMWQELVSPFVVVELLSPGTEAEDLGQTIPAGEPPTKWQVYEQILRVPYYIVFSRYTEQAQAFCLVGGRYEPVALTENRLSVPGLELSLGLWRGSYQNINRLWLQWLTTEGELILTPSEQAAAANSQVTAVEHRAIAAEQRAAEAEQKAAEAIAQVERLAAKLRELDIEPN